ncbi:MAG: phosphorylase family protein, partial [Gammaproteobacteria bacterium]
MYETIFKPHHINATPADLDGNNGIGRYIFLPGSEGRAKEIADRFDRVDVKHHQREHNLYLGTIKADGKKIDVAAIATGMGCPSTEIIVHELFNLGAKRFLRVGTSGSLQPGLIHAGDIINVQASVRDEDTTRHYAPLELPAISSLEFV